MKAKIYLQQIEKLDSQIKKKLSEVEKLGLIATGTTMKFESERVQSSGSKHSMENAICMKLDIESEVVEEVKKLFKLRQKIIHDIDQLPINEYEVIYRKYVEYKELYEIADDMGMSYSWVTSVHGRGLANIQKQLNERENDVNSRQEMQDL